jgi:outer membrane cobalamin receptor
MVNQALPGRCETPTLYNTVPPRDTPMVPLVRPGRFTTLAQILLPGVGCVSFALEGPAEEAVALSEIEVRAAPFSNTVLATPAIELLTEGETLKHSPSLSLDGILRGAPGFRLFRRTDSTVAHPTTQGVSLGNVGPNGSSRSLVLLDGVPMNDPFGGWVAWNRFLPSTLSGVRLVPQAGVSPWGTASLGGVIALDSRFLNEAPFAFIEASAGNRLRHQSAIAVAQDTQSGRTRLFGGVQETDFAGYPVIRGDRRGPVDIRASSQTESFDVGMRQALDPDANWNLTFRVQGWQETRNNGTPLTTNQGDALDFSARLTRNAGPRDWAAESIVYSQKRHFESAFSTVSPDRTTERPSLDQYAVPSQSTGFIQRLRFPLESGHALGTGLDLRTTEGVTRERFRYVGLSPTQEREAGGLQDDAGIYLQDTWTPSSVWQVHGGSRLEWNAQREARLREWEIVSQSAIRDLRYEQRTNLTPHFSLGSKWTPHKHFECSVLTYAGARNPTLNELYRPFRAGEVLTLANPTLRQESTTGGEFGVKILPSENSTIQLRAFENRIRDAIANINQVRGAGTFGDWGFLAAGAVGARRENIDSAAVRGLEARVEWKSARTFSVAAGWLGTQSEVKSCPIQRSLEGRSLPQVPTQQASLQAKVETDHWRWDISLRWMGRQFDDDANQYVLASVFTTDLRITRRIGSKTELFAAAENLSNAEIQTRREANGTVSVGTPRMWSAGLRRQF